MTWRTVSVVALVLAMGGAIPTMAGAQTLSAADTARRVTLLRAAHTALRASQYALALERVQEAEQIGATPGTHFLTAQIYQRQNRPSAAVRAAEQCLATATAQEFSPDELQELQRDCREIRDTALRSAVRLTLRVPTRRPAGMEVMLDGVVVPPSLYNVEQVVESGPVVLSTRLRGRTLWEESRVFAGGAAVSTEVQTMPSAVASPAVRTAPVVSAGTVAPTPAIGAQEVDASASSRGTMRALAFTTGIVGLVGIGMGVVSGVVFRGEEQSYESAGCAFMQSPSTSCVDQHAGFSTLNTLQYVGYLGGGALIATSAILFLAAPSATRAPALSLGVTPGGLQMGYSGRF